MSDVIDWKARCEKAEAETLKQLHVVHECTTRILQQDAELERVNKACAEMREVLEDLRDNAFSCGCTPGSFIYCCNSCAAKRRIAPALSTDAGASFRHKDEFKPILLLLGETMDHVPSELRSRIVSTVAEAKAKGLL